LLELENIDTFYGDTHILWDLSLRVPKGSAVAILGRNGMGKTTIIRSVIGLPAPTSGVVRFNGEKINGLAPFRIARKGIGLVPQGRIVFPSLSVKENLLVAARGNDSEGAWDLESIYGLFPILEQRAGLHANLLSGGEQQMLSIARALMLNPDLLLMDEPSEGLAPLVVRQIGQVICHLKGKVTVFLAEQNLSMALSVADHIYVISKGTVVWAGDSDALRDNDDVKHKWLGV